MSLIAAALMAGGIAGTAPSHAMSSGSTPAGGAPWRTVPIVWGSCAEPRLVQLKAQCGFLRVPLDHSDPGGRTIEIAVSRIRHTAPEDRYQGVLVANPGGPGGRGLALWTTMSDRLTKGVGTEYDLIGFDPRGIGASRPALSCDGNYFHYDRPDYRPTDPDTVKVWLARSKKYAQDCRARGGSLLDHLKTTDTAKDMDLLRDALRAHRLTYYGFSYGTYLGQVYATLFPDRVRRMVLDSNLDPGKGYYRTNLDQLIPFDRNVNSFYRWIARNDDVFHLGADGAVVAGVLARERDALRREPAGGVIGPDEFADVLVQSGYGRNWNLLANAVSAWVNDRDPAPLKQLYDLIWPQGEGADNSFAVFNAVECTDAPQPRDARVWLRDRARAAEHAPFTTWISLWYDAPCISWPARAGTPVTVDGAAVPPILLTGETLDAATPFEGSLAVRSLFPRSVLIEGVGGVTHAASRSAGDCLFGRIEAYLKTGALPARQPGRRSDIACEPTPEPVAARLP